MASETDWQLLKSLPERMLYMLDHHLMCDVTLLLGPDQEVLKAHKFMLCSASPVFYSMFEGQIAERDDVVIPDVDSNIFLDILRYIYSDKIILTVGNVKGILYAAEKYLIQNVKELCEDFLKTVIDIENAISLLDTSHMFNMSGLKSLSTKFISENTTKCLKIEKLEMVSADCLRSILEIDKTDASEHKLFKFAIRWAENVCRTNNMCVYDGNIRQVLGDLIFLLHFPAMNAEYFSKNVSTRNILTKEEIIAVFQTYHNSKTYIFPLQKRLPVLIRLMRCVPDVEEVRGWMEENVTFDKDVILKGIVMFGSKRSDDTYSVHLTIKRGPTILAVSKGFEIQTLRKSPLNNIWLKNCVKLNRNNAYTIRIRVKGPAAYRGKHYKPTCSQDGITVTFTAAQEPNNCTSPTVGQIPGLIVKVVSS